MSRILELLAWLLLRVSHQSGSVRGKNAAEAHFSDRFGMVGALHSRAVLLVMARETIRVFHGFFSIGSRASLF
jgi:hypothetical protein